MSGAHDTPNYEAACAVTPQPPLFRQDYERDEAPECKPGDYVRFVAIIVAEEHMVTTRNVTTMRSVQVLQEQSGSGQVLRLNATRKKAVPPRHRKKLVEERLAETLQFRTARIDAGRKLGTVLAVLNGAELVGEQLGITREVAS